MTLPDKTALVSDGRLFCHACQGHGLTHRQGVVMFCTGCGGEFLEPTAYSLHRMSLELKALLVSKAD